MLEDDRYIEMIRLARTEARSNAIISIVKLLIENDRLDGLELQVGLDAEVRDDPATAVPLIEAFVAKELRRFAGTMFVALSVDGIYRYPQHAFNLINMILYMLDEHEDPDSLLTMALSGEPPVFVLENMARFVYGEPAIHLEDVIEHVEPAVMTAITNILSVRSLEGQIPVHDNERFTRMATFVRTFPTMPDAGLYMESPVTTKPDDLMSQLGHVASDSEEDFLIRNAVGLCVFYHAKYLDAYQVLEVNLDLLNTHGLERMAMLEQAAMHLKQIYEVVRNAQAGVPENSM